jgi:TPP-dependent 2-oxoacid decarboxylase
MFNDINSWQDQMLLQMLGGGKGYEFRTKDEFDKVLSESLSNDTEVSLILVHIGREDHRLPLDRRGAGLAKIVHS